MLITDYQGDHNSNKIMYLRDTQKEAKDNQ